MNRSTTVNKLALYLSWVVGIIFVLLPFHAFLTVWLSSVLGHYTALRLWKEFLLAILSVGTIFLLLKDRKLLKSLLSSRLIQLVLLYIAVTLIWGGVSYAEHTVTSKALGYGVVVNLRFLVFFLVTWVIAIKSQWLKRNWEKLLLFPALAVITIGLIQKIFLPYDFLRHFGYSEKTIYPYETINHNVHYPRIMSTLRGANPLGAYLVVILTSIGAMLAKFKAKRYSGVVFFAGAAVVLILSFSRAAWLGFITSIVLLLWASLKTGKTKRLLELSVILSVIIGLAILLILRNNSTFENVFFHTQTHSASSVSSNAGHASALRSGVHDVIHGPLGRGPGTAGPASVYNHGKTRIAENYYIQIGQELGWVGLIVFLAINFLVAKELWLRRKDVLALALFASFVGLAVVNLFSHAWSDDTLAYIWWGFAGIALAA